jgi:multidrug resistance efflux pump
MSDAPDRIPIPPAQRWELFRERVVPAVFLAVTLGACGWLWQKQALVATSALGQVYADAVEIVSPVDGELLAVGSAEGGAPPLFTRVEREAVVARIQPRDSDGSGRSIELRSPLDGVVAATPTVSGQFVQRGQVLLKVASTTPNYIVCHLVKPAARPPEVGAEVAVRARGGGDSAWHASKVDAIGPAVEPAMELQGIEGLAPVRGLPVRVALPEDVELLPGSVVEVRFSPAKRAL